MTSIIIDPTQINLGAEGLEEIYQNVRTISLTRKGSVPLYRDFGVDTTGVDRPIPVARALFTEAIVTAVERWEPRVEVTELSWTESAEETIYGTIKPVIKFKVKDE